MQFNSLERGAAAALAALALAACGETIAPNAGQADSQLARTTHAAAHAEAQPVTDAATLAWLGQLRRTLAPFQRFEAAQEAGYTVKVTGCLVNERGNMGRHYGKPDLIFNDHVDPLAPELLLYEPQKNGRLKLVGVEYIIPFSEYGDGQAPPVVMGMEMHRNYRFNVWALHAWVFEHNPDGMFADWNPNVTCAYADDIE